MGTLISLISGLLAVFLAGIAAGRLIERIDHFLKSSKKDRPWSKK